MNKKFKNKHITKNIEKSIKLTLEDKRFFSYDIDYGHSYYMAGFSYHAFSIFLNEYGNPKNISFSEFIRYTHSFSYGEFKPSNLYPNRELKEIKTFAKSKVEMRNFWRENRE
jgi:hypothetical protein